MSTAARRTAPRKIDYPTSDGRPMAETDHHRELMTDSIQTLDAFFSDEPMTYVSGNLLICYPLRDVCGLEYTVSHKGTAGLFWARRQSQ